MTKAGLFVYLFLLLVVCCKTRPAQTQVSQWSPIENFQSRVNRLGKSLEYGGDSNTYYAIFKHLQLQKPKQAKDQLVCFLKTFTFTENKVLDPPANYLLDLLVNWGKHYSNAEEPGFTACQVDDEFRDKFEEVFEGIDIERVLAGEQMPKLVMIILERSIPVFPGTQPLDASRIRLEKANPILANLLVNQPQSLHSLYQMTNYWNRCEADSNPIIQKLRRLKLVAEEGKEYLDLYSMSHHLTFPETVQWKEVEKEAGLPQQSLSSQERDPTSVAAIADEQNPAASNSHIQPPPIENRFVCSASCQENLQSLAKVLIALGDSLEGTTG